MTGDLKSRAAPLAALFIDQNLPGTVRAALQGTVTFLYTLHTLGVPVPETG